MKKFLAVAFLLMMSPVVLRAEGIRILLLDCRNDTGAASGGAAAKISADAVAGKGVHFVGKQLLNVGGYTLIDRRDLTTHAEKFAGDVAKAGGKAAPSFLQTAQILKADVILRISLVSMSSSKESINQGGTKTEMEKLTIRVALEAIDPVDGAVVGLVDGSGAGSFRQTENIQTSMSEDDVLVLFEKAAIAAVNDLKKTMDAWVARSDAKAAVNLTLTTSDDPALVEIDGMLIGSTPLKDFKIKVGDHSITVGRAGYVDISKRILLQKDTEIRVPMLRKELSADELKDILKNLRVGVMSGFEPALIIKTQEQNLR